MRNNKLNLFSAVIFLFFISFLIACEESNTSREINRPNVSDPSGADGPISTPADSNPIDGNDTPDSGGTPIGGGGGGGGTGGGTGGDDDDDDVVMDDPSPPAEGTGIIRGMVVSSGSTPLNGVHVRAVNVDDTNIQISSFSGIDCDLDYTFMVTGGKFCIQNVPAGTYRVLIEGLVGPGKPAAFDPDRYSPYIINEVTDIEFPDEYWNGVSESNSDDPMEVETIVVIDGMTVAGIDFVTNDGP